MTRVITRNLIERIAELRADDVNQSFGYHSRVSFAYRCMCMTIPKVACTTLKYVLETLDGHDLPDDWGVVHNGGRRLASLTSAEIAKVLTSPDWFRFAFVRNPYARLFSAWKSKITVPWDDYYVQYQDRIRAERALPSGRDEQRSTIPFRDFAEWVMTTDDVSQRDGHWNVQSRVLMIDFINYDIIGRFEAFREDLEHVLSMVGAPGRAFDAAAEIRNPTWQVPLASAYDRLLAARVYEYYLADFEAFGYERDSWMY